MNLRFTLVVLALAGVASLAAMSSLADEAAEHSGQHAKGRGAGHDSKDDCEEDMRGPKAAVNAAYAAACGGCHFVYPAQLLPKKSWEKTLASLGDHFGAEVKLSERDRRAVAGYLLGNAADATRSEVGRKVARSLGGAAPMRVLEVPYIQRKHREIAPEVLARKGVGGLANCAACHPGAAGLDFEDDRVRIPAR